ncbi:hypothetical protein ACFWOJ_34595 [Streptomyces sp. NPDC058439]|uniref:hypothetical protein n=1 Tax=Streptomyces sp. NPDC058439 TaxID=3346500 RepID=UPI00364C4331
MSTIKGQAPVRCLAGLSQLTCTPNHFRIGRVITSDIFMPHLLRKFMTRRWALITTITVLTVALAFVGVQLVRGQDSGKEQAGAKPAASSPGVPGGLESASSTPKKHADKGKSPVPSGVLLEADPARTAYWDRELAKGNERSLRAAAVLDPEGHKAPWEQ